MMVWHCHARPPPKQVAEAPKIKKRPVKAAVTKSKNGNTSSHIKQIHHAICGKVHAFPIH